MPLLDRDAHEVKPRQILIEAALPLTEFSKEFLTGMLNRMGMSHFKYGTVVGTKGKIDHVAGAFVRIDRYKEDGNKEWLMDAANMLMIEFMVENQVEPKPHYTPQDSDTSPGRVGLNGALGRGHNDSLLWKRH